MLAAALVKGQAVTNLAARLSLDSAVCSVDSVTVPYVDFLRQLQRAPRAHVFGIRVLVRNNSDSTLDFSLGYGELDYIDAQLGWLKAQGGKMRRTPTGANYLQRQTEVLPLRLAAQATRLLDVTIRPAHRRIFL